MKQYRVLYETEANDGQRRTFTHGITEDLKKAGEWLEAATRVYGNPRVEVREVSKWEPFALGEWCEVDDCPASICGGPHVKHVCLDEVEVASRMNDRSPCPFCSRLI